MVAVQPQLIPAQPTAAMVATPPLGPGATDVATALMMEEKRIVRAVLENPEAQGDFKAFEEAVFALSNICKNKLFRGCGSGSQADYGKNRWNITGNRLNQLIACVPVLIALSRFPRRPDSDKVVRMILQCRRDEAGWQELWARVLETQNPSGRITGAFVMQVHTQMQGADGGPSIEWVPPEELVKEVEAFLGEISLDPVWHPQSPVQPKICFGRLANGSYLDASNSSWEAPNTEGTVFLNVSYGADPARAAVFNLKLQEEYQIAHVREAISLIRMDLSEDWVVEFCRKYPWVMLASIRFTRCDDIAIDGSNKKKRRRKADAEVDGYQYALVYMGKRRNDFYRHFERLGLAPGLNSMAYGAAGPLGGTGSAADTPSTAASPAYFSHVAPMNGPGSELGSDAAGVGLGSTNLSLPQGGLPPGLVRHGHSRNGSLSNPMAPGVVADILRSSRTDASDSPSTDLEEFAPAHKRRKSAGEKLNNGHVSLSQPGNDVATGAINGDDTPVTPSGTAEVGQFINLSPRTAEHISNQLMEQFASGVPGEQQLSPQMAELFMQQLEAMNGQTNPQPTPGATGAGAPVLIPSGLQQSGLFDVVAPGSHMDMSAMQGSEFELLNNHHVEHLNSP